MTDPVHDGVRCMLDARRHLEGAVLPRRDLPLDPAERDDLLLRVMGRPDPRQIDGLGGAHTLTSKVAVVSPSSEPDVDIDYLFLQLGRDQPTVSDAQKCGNILAGRAGRSPSSAGSSRRAMRPPRCASDWSTPATWPRQTFPHACRSRRLRGASTVRAIAACPVPPPASTSRWRRRGETPALLPTGNVVDTIEGIEYAGRQRDAGGPAPRAEFGLTGDESPTSRSSGGTRRCRRAHPTRRVRSWAWATYRGTVAKTCSSRRRSAAGDHDPRVHPTRCTPRSACSGRSCVVAGVCCRARSAPTSPTRPTTAVRGRHPAARSPRRSSVAPRETARPARRSTSVRTARKIFDGMVFPRPRLQHPTRQRGLEMTAYTASTSPTSATSSCSPRSSRKACGSSATCSRCGSSKRRAIGLPARLGRVPAHTIKLTALSTPPASAARQLPHQHPDALDRRVAAIEATGLGEGWADGEVGTGPTYLFRDPDGHSMGVYYETERYVATDLEPALKNQASAFPGRGSTRAGSTTSTTSQRTSSPTASSSPRPSAAARASGSSWMPGVTPPGGSTSTTSRTTWSTPTTGPGTATGCTTSPSRPDTREDILRAADIVLENGIYIESGPHKHAIDQTFFFYVWEPGGNRIELANAGARLLLAPDSPVVEWTQEERKKGQAWGMKTIESFHTHGTPSSNRRRHSRSSRTRTEHE